MEGGTYGVYCNIVQDLSVFVLIIERKKESAYMVAMRRMSRCTT